jgi:hypothetical protein
MNALGLHSRDHAGRVAASIERRMSAMTQNRIARRTTRNVMRALWFEMAIVLFVGTLLFIH